MYQMSQTSDQQGRPYGRRVRRRANKLTQLLVAELIDSVSREVRLPRNALRSRKRLPLTKRLVRAAIHILLVLTALLLVIAALQQYGLFL